MVRRFPLWSIIGTLIVGGAIAGVLGTRRGREKVAELAPQAAERARRAGIGAGTVLRALRALLLGRR